jgi:hypothetical protein
MKNFSDDFEDEFQDDFEDDYETDYPENYMPDEDEDEMFQKSLRMKNLKKHFNPNPVSQSDKWKEEKPYSPIKPNDLSLEKYLEKKKSMKLKESDLERIVKKVLSEQMKEHANYMFFSNLQQIKRQCEMMLDMDPDMIDKIIQDGHDWADDHISEAKTNMDQVFDFFKNQMSKESDYLDYEDINEGRKKTGTPLCSRGKAAAKSKFKVYPSAYANGYAVQVCKGKIKGLDGKKHCSGSYC